MRLMAGFADEVVYSRGGTCVTLVKRLPSRGTKV
jgi:hypothetical protein